MSLEATALKNLGTEMIMHEREAVGRPVGREGACRKSCQCLRNQQCGAAGTGMSPEASGRDRATTCPPKASE